MQSDSAYFYRKRISFVAQCDIMNLCGRLPNSRSQKGPQDMEGVDSYDANNIERSGKGGRLHR